MEDIDTGTGDIVAQLRQKCVLENTLIIVTSDNGPWFLGDTEGRRGRKFQTWDGGILVPFIAQWPAFIPAGRTVAAPMSGVDIFPTILSLLHLPLPSDRIIDGQNFSVILADETTVAEDHYIYYFDALTLDAVRNSRFKYHRRRGVHALGMGDTLSIDLTQGPFPFDYSVDSHESYDVSLRQPQHTAHLRAVFEQKRSEMAVNPRGWR